MWQIAKRSSPMDRDFDAAGARRELQLASIADIQGSIQANDTKTSAALVVNGLLFAGVLSIVSRLADVYDHAALGARIAGYVLLAVAAMAFAVSVLALIDSAHPYEPEETRKRARSKHAFFPTVNPKAKAPGGTVERHLKRLAKLQTAEDFAQEYAGEQIQLADIRITEAESAKRGFLALRYELAAVGLFLLLVAFVAADSPVLTTASAKRDVAVRWQITQRREVTTRSAGGAVIVARRGRLRLGLAAHGSGVTALQLLGTAAWLCPGRGEVPIVEPLAAAKQRDGGTKRLAVSASLVQPTCRQRRHPRLRASLVALGRAGGAVAQGQLTLSTR